MNSGTKRNIYLVLWVIAGILLGILVGGLIEYEYLYFDVTEVPQVAIYSIAILTGVALGVWIGPKSWKKVYGNSTIKP